MTEWNAPRGNAPARQPRTVPVCYACRRVGMYACMHARIDIVATVPQARSRRRHGMELGESALPLRVDA